jgi:uracil-DNA glycosylase family 4
MLISQRNQKIAKGAIFLSKKGLLDAVASEVVVCTKCDLWKGRKKAVPGEGSSQSKIMFIGEAPGQTEDSEGRPFVGAAGKFLETLISGLGLMRTDVFICNIVKCRPPKNREPRPIEIQTCTPYLDRQINIIKPKFVVALGSHSAAYVFQKANLPFNGITKARGKLCQARILDIQMTVFPTFHPAAALYMTIYKEQLTRDFNVLKQELEKRGIVARTKISEN